MTNTNDASFESIYDEDLPGFLAVKTHFWDKGKNDVEVYVRRRTLEGDWIWLATSVVSYMEQPVPGYIFRERRAENDEHAAKMNRITRIAAILVQAVEAASVVNTAEATPTNEASSNPQIPWVADDAAAYQSWLAQASGASDGNLSNSTNPLKNIMNEAATGGQANPNGSKEAESTQQKSQIQMEIEAASAKEAFDPLAELKELKTGICLDMGMISLSRDEVKLMTLILSGRIAVDDIGSIVWYAMTSLGQDLNAAMDMYVADKAREAQMQQQQILEANAAFALNAVLLPPLEPIKSPSPPAISVINLSYTYMGNRSMKMLSEVLHIENSPLTTIDISFCGLEEKGLLAFARGVTKRKQKGIPALRGVLLSGNKVSYRAARALGIALSSSLEQLKARKRRSVSDIKRTPIKGTEYESDTESGNEGESSDLSAFSGSESKVQAMKGSGLRVLHVSNASISPEALYQLLYGLGADCPLRELSIHSNKIGPKGATLIVEFLEGKFVPKNQTVMPFLDRLDLSNNELGNDGTAKLTRAISKRSKVHLVDLRLSANNIGAGGVETIMNKLLQHKLISLSLDMNSFGDQGCQLVAASLQSMHQLARLNLSFNEIGCRGVTTLMRTLVGCESITYLGLSGNTLKISGAMAMGFTLAQHPRLEELDMDNCCLSQAAQCHIIAGIISNRWVPMKKMTGFQAAPPMVALGALDVNQHHLSNEECFRLRRDEQMKTILQWMETNRAAKLRGASGSSNGSQAQYLTPEFVSSINDVHGMPSQNAYLRMLGWLSKIPFDEDELNTLRKYFYDADGGEGDRGSDGYINLKLRGDLLAALDADVADEIRDALPVFAGDTSVSVGLDLDHLDDKSKFWLAGTEAAPSPGDSSSSSPITESKHEEKITALTESVPLPEISLKNDMPERSVPNFDNLKASKKRRIHSSDLQALSKTCGSSVGNHDMTTIQPSAGQNSLSSTSKQSLARTSSDRSTASYSERRSSNALKPRITMFPPFEQKLEELKTTAKDMIDNEEDPAQQDVILTQYAEASLTILRQLRYHCMNSGLDGWRQGGLRRKVLIVDDSKVTRKLVSRAFEKANFIVDTAENGVEGVAKLKQSIYDIAFMDIDMPVMNGFEATKALRLWEDVMRPGARQPICALTAAYVDDFERSELMKFKEAGLDVMESKPCNIPRLFKVVDDVSPMFSDLSISVTQLESSSSGAGGK